MKKKLYNLLNEEGKKYIDETRTNPYLCAEEHLEGFIEEEFSHSDSDENYYNVVFEHKGKFYSTEYAHYELACFTSWGEEMSSNRNVMIEIDEVKKVTKTIEVWEAV